MHGELWLSRASDDALVMAMTRGDNGAEIERLRITSSDGQLHVERGDARSLMPATGEKVIRFQALVGTFRLLAGPYLAVVTKASLVGMAPNAQRIFRIEKMELVPVSLSARAALSPRMRKDERRYEEMLQQIVATRALLFAPGYDITLTQQRIAELAAAEGKSGAAREQQWRRADLRFWWNRHASQDFANDALGHWVTVVMSGFVSIDDRCQIDGNEFRYLLITRRGVERQGRRFVVRGIDQLGNVANYAETEQIAEFPNGHVTAYVQIRGGIPVFWQQVATIKYMPLVEMTADDEESLGAMTLHFKQQVEKYGDVICVNLIDKKKDQLALGRTYERLLERMEHPQVRYIWFDFHDECKKMRWHMLSKLIDQVGDDLEKIGFFWSGDRGQILSLQRGVIRTNCMDNLDRTNVVQSLFARRSILAQLQIPAERMGKTVLDSPFAVFERTFKNAWADNADIISLLYSGTGALKTDFTRTGKRSVAGLYSDFVNSVVRYHINNFRDGDNQDSIDLFLGKFEPYYAYARGQEERYRSPFARSVCSPQTNSVIIKMFLLLIIAIFLLVTRCSLRALEPRRFVNQPAFVQWARPPVPSIELEKARAKKTKKTK